MTLLRRKKSSIIEQPGWNTSEDEYDRVIKLVFDGVRNLLICASLFGLATYAGRELQKPFGGYLEVLLIGIAGILLAALLGQWNRKTSRKNFKNTKLFLIVSAFYILMLPVIMFLLLLFMKKQG